MQHLPHFINDIKVNYIIFNIFLDAILTICVFFFCFFFFKHKNENENGNERIRVSKLTRSPSFKFNQALITKHSENEVVPKVDLVFMISSVRHNCFFFLKKTENENGSC